MNKIEITLLNDPRVEFYTSYKYGYPDIIKLIDRLLDGSRELLKLFGNWHNSTYETDFDKCLSVELIRDYYLLLGLLPVSIKHGWVMDVSNNAPSGDMFTGNYVDIKSYVKIVFSYLVVFNDRSTKEFVYEVDNPSWNEALNNTVKPIEPAEFDIELDETSIVVANQFDIELG